MTLKHSLLLAAMMPMVSFAAVEKVSYIDLYGASQSRSILQNHEIFINNNSNVSFNVSSGLDRRLNFVVKRGNTVISDTTTDVINIDDLISDGGKSYYGKIFSVNMNSDSDYSVEVTTLSLSGDEIDTETYLITRDTLPPTSGPITIKSYGGTTNNLTPDNIWYTGYYHDNHFQVSSISDAGSGIAKVELVSFTTAGGKKEYKRKTLNFDENAKLAQFDFDKDSGFLPTDDNGDTIYGVEYHITDNSGNVHITPMQQMYYDTVGSRGLELIAYREPGSSNVIGGEVGYVPYVSGNTVNENPISIMYRMPANEHSNNHRGGYYPVGQSKFITNQNDGYYYIVFTRPHGFTDGNYIRFSDRRSWVTSSISYNLKLSPNAPKAPVRVGHAEYLWSDIGWSSWDRWHIQNDQLPLTITGSRQRVEPRPYVQRWIHAGHECLIPVGSEKCEILHAAWNLSKGSSAYFHQGSTIESQDKALYGSPSWADSTYNDQHYPKINAVSLNGLDLIANIEQPSAGSWFDNLRLRNTWLEDKNGNKLSVNRTALSRNGIYYEAVFDLNSLEEGEHDLIVVAEEMHGPTTKKSAFEYLSDRTAPTLSVTYHSEDIPEIIADLRELEINISDALSEVKIDELTLMSTDGLVDVLLGYTLKTESDLGKTKVFSPELPRLFPTLEEGVTYTLSITVSDAYNNNKSMQQSFMYIPDNLIQLGTINYLPVDAQLDDEDDNSLATITSNELKLDDGRMATGNQQAFVSLQSSAEFSVRVNGNIVVKPGETKQMSIDLGDSGGSLNIPIYPDVSGTEGVGSILFEIPQLSSQYDN
ncbi:Ig-like domain-containing protein [Vibrio sp. 10N.239.312.D08]|uniref:Ig-like domain-containing protein n=1 Tax=Vibrio sp. 10N.239.312.D08 TaxID=3229978 RepID=UPI00354E8647